MIPRYRSKFKLKYIFKAFNFGCYSLPLNYLTFTSASKGLTFILKNLPDKIKRVGIPLYTCKSVHDAVLSSGLEVVYIDFVYQKNGYLINFDQLDKVDIFIPTHYFGVRYDISEINRKFPNLLIIEDCSHCNVCEHRQNFINIIASIYSFNIHKKHFLFGGGLVIVYDSRYINYYNSLLKDTNYQWLLRSVPVILKDLFFMKYLYTFMYKLVSFRRKESKLVVNPFGSIFRASSTFNSLLTYILFCEENVEKKFNEEFLEKFSDNISNLNVKMLYFPVFIEESQRDKVLDDFLKRNIEVFVLWNKFLSVAPIYVENFSKDDFPLTINMFKDVLFIPEGYVLK